MFRKLCALRVAGSLPHFLLLATEAGSILGARVFLKGVFKQIFEAKLKNIVIMSQKLLNWLCIC